jgi:hypothetical protein
MVSEAYALLYQRKEQEQWYQHVAAVRSWNNLETSAVLCGGLGRTGEQLDHKGL